MQRKRKHSDVEKKIEQSDENTWSSWFHSLPAWEKVVVVGIAAGATVATLGGISLLFISGNPSGNSPQTNINPDPIPFNPAEECRGLITASPYGDNSDIKDISSYESGAGHPFGRWQDCFNQEGVRTNYADNSCCESLKHYVRFQPNGKAHSLYALGDVKITKMTPEYGGVQLDLSSAISPNIHFRIFHVDLIEGLQESSILKSGQSIGTANPKSWSDVAVEYFGPNGEYGHLSMFECMNDETLRSFGFHSREEALEKMTYRGEHPNCTNAHQSMRSEDSPEDFVSCCDILAKAVAAEKRNSLKNSLWNSFSSFFSSKPESADNENKELKRSQNSIPSASTTF